MSHNNLLETLIPKMNYLQKLDNVINATIGGCTDEEIIKISKKGFKIISLGKRILQTETVSMNILSIINE